jgi:pyruvate-ferredoxin/flavodoxin oxidoreductase
MRFRRSERPAERYSFPGHADVLDGRSAADRVERMTSDVLATLRAHAGDELFGSSAEIGPDGAAGARIYPVATARELAALLTGCSLEGLRACAFAAELDGASESLTAAVGKRVPIVVHLLCRASTRQSGSLRGAHDGYYELAGTGGFLMFATDVQEVADFALIAHRVAERSLTPGVCAQDLYGTSHSVQNLRVPEPGLVRDYLGLPGDTISCPTEAQKVLLGDERRRIPVWLDPDRPVGVGGVQDAESYFRAVAAQQPFFFDHLPAIMDEAMRDFAERTGRVYSPVSAYRVDDAEVVVVAQGAVVGELKWVVDRLRTEKGIKAGVVNVSVLRPFPGAALSALLKGRKVVTVLERSDRALAEDPPLLRDLRAAIDRAIENGGAPDDVPFPDYASYRRFEDRPRILSGVYGVGGRLPGFAELAAVFGNMARRGRKTRFYVGASFEADRRRFPHLEALQRHLLREYPHLPTLFVEAESSFPQAARTAESFQLWSLSIQGGLFAGSIFAQAMADALGRSVRTFPDGGLDRSLQPTHLTVASAAAPGGTLSNPCARPLTVDTMLVSGEMLIEALPMECALEKGGLLIVGSVQEPSALWRSLSGRAAGWIRDGEFRLHALDARKIAAETASHPSFIDQLSIWALLGAYTKACLRLPPDDHHRFVEGLRSRLDRVFGADRAMIDEVLRTVARGAAELVPVAWRSWREVPHPVGEPRAPWPVRQAAELDDSVFDPTRFWRSVGYLYDRGQSVSTLPDPYLATGVLPARSSAFRDMSRYRLRIPEWIPGNCTGCGACWTQCPESALPPTIRSLPELIDAAMRACEKTGGALIQMKRLGDQLSKQAYKVAAREGPQPRELLTVILEEAFTRIVDKLGIADDRLGALRAEFQRLCAAASRFPVAVTDCFFTEPHRKEAGSGRLLSIALNPLSCTACGICLAECPERAFDWSEQTAEKLDDRRRDWDFLMALPPLSSAVVGSHVSAEAPDTNVHRLLDNAAYHSLVGGDGSFPGNGAKTAVHLLTATIESVMQPRFSAHVERLSDLIRRVENKIQGKVDSAVRINDFEDFGRRLSRVGKGQLTPEALRGLLGDEKATGGIDPAQLGRLTALLFDLNTQRHSYTTGYGRSRMVLTIDPGAAGFWNGTYPYNPHSQPWVAHLPGDAPALARGVWEGVARRLCAEVAACRKADLELDDAYDPSVHDASPGAISWKDLTREERSLAPVVLVLGRSGVTRWESVSELLASGLPVRIALIDDKGVQMTAAAGGEVAIPLDGSPLRALTQAQVFAMQTSIGAPGHLMQGLAEALSFDGPALFRIYAPDPVMDGIVADQVVEQARRAYQSRAVPLYVVRPDGHRAGISLEGNPNSDGDWTSHDVLVKDSSGAESPIVAPLTLADWAVRQARFRRHFKIVARGNRSDRTLRLSDYLALPPEERAGIQPYIDVRDREGRHVLATVSAEMTDAAERVHVAWRELQAIVRGCRQPRITGPERTVLASPATASAATPSDAQALQRLTDNLLRLAGYGHDEPFFRRSLREFAVAKPSPPED